VWLFFSLLALPTMLRFRALLVDIEGTTTPISFVHDILFPLARERLETFLEEHWTRASVQESVARIREQARVDVAAGERDCPIIPEVGTDEELRQAVVKNVRWQMDRDRKTGGLKLLQGQIWRYAYESGQVKGQVYDDVPLALEHCKRINLPVYVYSSGSVEAQKLLFTYSDHGNLQPLFAGNFDTAIGSKQSADAYKRIAEAIQLPVQDILFLSDNTKEVEAALTAGMQAAVVCRPGNAPLTEQERSKYRLIHSFDEIIKMMHHF
jgi:enolase-phosphatase E1